MAAKKKILVIGGSGFIGRTLVPYLSARDCDVAVLNRGNRKPENAHQLIADRNVEAQMAAAAAQAGDFDAVVDTSAYTVMQAEIAWRYFSPKAAKWIHISSGAVYANYQSKIPHKETDPIGGAEIWGAYGSDKSAIDTFLHGRQGPAQTIILRPPYIYGPGNDIDRETFVWSRAEAGLPVIIPAKDDTPMQFIHVADLADSIYTCIEGASGANAIYNVAGDEIVTIRDWVAMLMDICSGKKDAKIIRNTLGGYAIRQYFPFRDSAVFVDASLIKRELHWQAKYKIREGFEQTYATHTAEDLAKYLKNMTDAEKEIAAKLTHQ